ncbi:unnamed protein product [Heligmosomoides polygyrus]|uniref:Protein RETICULATA-RELATED 4, chloroplastic-like n=1 Tax=Heligmosomoides polygyrus TaxID=6339 RepID=A0A183FPG0_HELPZ|nr:unnamed protein product [Heligmosomoides polygyrus]
MIGLESWFHNFSQFIYRANTPEVLADIPRPYVEYSIWGLFKGAEITSVLGNVSLGGLVAHPLYRWYLTRQLTPEKTTPNSHKIIRSLQGRFLLCGLVAGPVAAVFHSWTIDMCYAIRCDTNALSMDRFVLLLGFVGWYWKRFQGAVDGINVAVVYALINAKVCFLLLEHCGPAQNKRAFWQEVQLTLLTRRGYCSQKKSSQLMVSFCDAILTM